MTYPDPYRPMPPAPRRRVWPWLLGGAFALLLVIGACSAAVTGAARSGAAGPQSAVSPVSPGVVATAVPPSLQAQAGPATSAGDGAYEVGPDLAPGKYKTPGPDGSSAFRTSCYWERSKDDSGEFGSIIANDNISGPGTLTVKAGEVLKLSGPCTWTKS